MLIGTPGIIAMIRLIQIIREAAEIRTHTGISAINNAHKRHIQSLRIITAIYVVAEVCACSSAVGKESLLTDRHCD